MCILVKGKACLILVCLTLKRVSVMLICFRVTIVLKSSQHEDNQYIDCISNDSTNAIDRYLTSSLNIHAKLH